MLLFANSDMIYTIISVSQRNIFICTVHNPFQKYGSIHSIILHQMHDSKL